MVTAGFLGNQRLGVAVDAKILTGTGNASITKTTMKETSVVQKIRDWMVKEGCLALKHHGSVYSYKGHADIYGVLPCGRAFFLEVKVPGKKPEPHQEAFLKLAAKSGAVTGWCDSLEGAKKIITPHLTH